MTHLDLLHTLNRNPQIKEFKPWLAVKTLSRWKAEPGLHEANVNAQIQYITDKLNIADVQTKSDIKIVTIGVSGVLGEVKNHFWKTFSKEDKQMILSVCDDESLGNLLDTSFNFKNELVDFIITNKKSRVIEDFLIYHGTSDTELKEKSLSKSYLKKLAEFALDNNLSIIKRFKTKNEFSNWDDLNGMTKFVLEILPFEEWIKDKNIPFKKLTTMLKNLYVSLDDDVKMLDIISNVSKQPKYEWISATLMLATLMDYPMREDLFWDTLLSKPIKEKGPSQSLPAIDF